MRLMKMMVVTAVGLMFYMANAVSLILSNGDPVGVMPATLANGPVFPLAFYSSPATPDDAGNFVTQVDSAITVGNTYGANSLTFWYKVYNLNGSPLVALGVPLPSLNQLAVNQTSAGNNASSLALFSAALSLVWAGQPILSTQESEWQSVETPLTQYKFGRVGVIDGTSEDVTALVPIPETSTYLGMFALGLAGFAAYRRFKQ